MMPLAPVACSIALQRSPAPLAGGGDTGESGIGPGASTSAAPMPNCGRSRHAT
jgi:hypothetical protein